jgi:hypothetical protein
MSSANDRVSIEVVLEFGEFALSRRSSAFRPVLRDFGFPFSSLRHISPDTRTNRRGLDLVYGCAQSIRPRRRALLAASVRLFAFKARKTAATCTLMVPSLSCNSRQISLFDIPAANRRNTHR